MTISPNSDLKCLQEGAQFLTRRPWQVLSLAALGMVLSALAPFIQVRAGLQDDLMISSAVMFAAIIPLELYFIPRFLIQADAEAGGNPQNAAPDWQARFEARWLRAFGAKVLVGLAAGFGLACLLLPGLLFLLAFGWVPLRVLLKGEPFMIAARGSVQMMVRAWRRILLTTAFLAMAYLVGGLAVGFLVGLFVPEPTLSQRMVHPALWLGNFAATLLSLWLSACFLALFRRLDQTLADA